MERGVNATSESVHCQFSSEIYVAAIMINVTSSVSRVGHDKIKRNITWPFFHNGHSSDSVHR